MNYSTSYLMEYLPKRYSATPEQEQNRQAVYSFKDGACPLRIKEKLCEKILDSAKDDKNSWIVLFIPASTSYKTLIRYEALARYIESKTNVKASISAIQNKMDCEAKHLSGSEKSPSEVFNFNPSLFRGKKVILIDDVTTTGHSFRNCASILSSMGAASVCGLFVAKTINPDWNSGSCYFDPEDYYEEEPDFDPEDYYEEEPDFDPEDYFEPDFF